ncbi:MAG: beta-glucosidase BglX [Dysgonamonadaceae bacterium]|jgi:beta-glucosidase|nr:beta-glucosidase BglX [Dysgonamonadaceae bacterium]
MKKILCLFCILTAITACKQTSSHSNDKEMNRYIDNLMREMTLEEKIGQMNQLAMGFDITGPILNEGVENKIKAGLVGSVLGIYTPEATRKLQEIAVKDSRLGIPILFGYDVIHGHRTIFPVNLGLAATWNPALIEQTARIAADEAASDGLHWTFSPMVDIVRDPRWGRVSESAGEDPYLGSIVAKAMIQGYQQDDLSRNNTVLACVKHFALYGAAEAGRDYNTVDMSKIRMYNEYLPPYKAGADAGAATFMTSFNEIDGVPATGNRWLFTDLLRDEWGYQGFVVTDYTAILEMIEHGVGDEAGVAELSLNAGIDMEMVSELICKHGVELVKSGKIPEKVINQACRRILEAKYRLGLFDDPYKYCNAQEKDKRSFTPGNLQIAKEVAIKSMVLLKNGKQILPLDSTKRIAFIGAQVQRKRDLIGSWSAAGDWNQAVSVWEALENKFGAKRFLYAQGCNILEDTVLIKKLNRDNAQIALSEKSPQYLIQEAVNVARRADVVVAVLGETAGMTGEAASRSGISLPENQKELLKALKQTGKPIVLVLMNGRPLTLQWENDNLDAILETWFGGTMAGPAIADVLFGDAAPSGKITMTYPRNVGQIPIYYNHKNTGRPIDENQKYTSKYLDVSNEPLYPFGYGLSYTTFEYSDLKVDGQGIAGQARNDDGLVKVSCTVKNTGNRAATETVQLYLRDKIRSITPPVKELKGFQQIVLQAGESKTVHFEITEDDLKFYNSALKWVAEPGEFDVFVGGNSRDIQQASFTY